LKSCVEKRLKIAAKPLHMEPCPTAPSPTSYDLPFSYSTYIRTIGMSERVVTLQGHPRSMIFVSIERQYATF